jgi:hypothetical protein
MNPQLDQLYETFQVILGEDGPIDEEGDYLIFPTTLSLFQAQNYTQQLGLTNLPKILNFFLEPALAPADLDYFLARCTEFIYTDTWPADLGDWLQQAEQQGRSYPEVTHIKMNNLRLILWPEDLPRLRQVFPNLSWLEYIIRDSYNPAYDHPQVSQADLQAAFPAGVLAGFEP